MKKGFTLAEGATHIAMSNKKQSFGFTLAEVLITLGITGVVAAITMPTLIQNYKKQVYVNQLKKTVSMLEQGFQKMLADEGVEKLSDLSYWENYHTYTPESTRLLVDKFLSKSFKASEIDGYIQFPDGSTITWMGTYGSPVRQLTPTQCENAKALGGHMCSLAITMTEIDVNGVKKPNEYGRDIFLFYGSDEGKLYPFYGKDHALFETQTELSSNHEYWRNKNNTGYAARIIENGWKMDY